MKVGLRIKEIREQKKISQRELSNKLRKYNQSQISKIEKGERKITIEELSVLARALEVSVIDLLDELL